MTVYTLNSKEVKTLKEISPYDEIHYSENKNSYIYRKILDPTNQNSKYYVLFFKHESDNKWRTKPGLLSDSYTIVPTEYVMNNIKKAIQNNPIQNLIYLNRYTLSVAKFEVDGISDINLNDNNDIKTILKFKISTELNLKDFKVFDKLLFILNNSYGGERKLNISYGIETNIINNEKELKYINLFLLYDFRSYFKHMNMNEVALTDFLNIKNQIQTKINTFKNTKIDGKILEELEKKLSKKQNILFNGLYEKIKNTSFNNLYFLTYLLSALFNNKTIFLNHKVEELNSIISKYIN